MHKDRSRHMSDSGRATRMGVRLRESRNPELVRNSTFQDEVTKSMLVSRYYSVVFMGGHSS
jgi:hypothetical protein